MTTRSREPDLAKELDRADGAAEAEVDEENPSPAQQLQLLRAQVNLGHPTIGEFCSALRNGRCRQRDCQVDRASLPISRVRRTIDAENSTGCSFATVLPIQPGLRHGHDGSKNSVRSRKPPWSRQGRSRRFLFFFPADSRGVGWCVGFPLAKSMHQFRSHRLQLRLIVAKPILATPSQTRLVRACGFSISFHVQGPNGRI